MNLGKSELKMLVAKGFGDDLFTRVEKAKAQGEQFKGAVVAYGKAEEIINQVTQLVSEEARTGKIDVEGSDPMDIAKYAVAKLMSASKKIHELSDNATNSVIRAEGLVVGYENAAKMARTMFDEEAAKIEALKRAISDGTVREEGDKLAAFDGPGSSRVPGMHPGLPMKAQRQAEDEAVKRVDKGNGASASAEPESKVKRKRAASKKSKKRPKKKADAKDA